MTNKRFWELVHLLSNKQETSRGITESIKEIIPEDELKDFLEHFNVSYYKEPNKMELDKFWQTIDTLNYKSDLDFERVENEMLSILSTEEIKEFQETFNVLYSDLERLMDELLQEEIGLGDNSLSDLLSHMIGLGKEYYDKAYGDVSYLSSHANGKFDTIEGYSESFAYIFNNVE